MVQIFLSYSRKDSNRVKELAELLSHGCDVWYDQAPKGILGGENWWEAIIREIGRCEYFICLISENSIESKYCQKELDKALELDKKIIPVRIRGLSPKLEKLEHLQLIELYGEFVAIGVSQIYGAILRNAGNEMLELT